MPRIHLYIPLIVTRPHLSFNTSLIKTITRIITADGITQSFLIPIHKRRYLLHHTWIGHQDKQTIIRAETNCLRYKLSFKNDKRIRCSNTISFVLEPVKKLHVWKHSPHTTSTLWTQKPTFNLFFQGSRRA